MRILFVFTILFYCFGLFAQNQSKVVKGYVIDNKTFEPLSGVQVFYGVNKVTITNFNGEFSFKADTTNINIVFQYLGYKLYTKKTKPFSNDTLTLRIELQAITNELDEIVISANKTEQKVSDLTVSMNLIKPNTILENHIVNAEEIVNQTSGIEVMDGQASIRGGSGYSYGAGSRVLALIDGLPVLSDDASNIRWQFLPLENISQIEIIKGASSVLYGSSALNGIINFRTAEAGIKADTKFSVLTGIFDKPIRSNWKWWDSPRMYSNASFTFSKRFGDTDVGIGSSFLLDNGYRKLNDEKLGRINIMIKHRSRQFSLLNYGVKINAGYNVKQDFILWEDADFGALKQNEATAIELNGLFFTIDPFISFTKENRYKHDFRMRIQSSQNNYPKSTQNNSNTLSGFSEYQFGYFLPERLNIIAGVAHKYSKINSNFYNDHEGNNIAVYTQLDYEPIDKLKLVGGVRIEQNILDGDIDKLVPIFRSGINYHLAEFTFLRASFGQGYRYPSIAEKHAYTKLGTVSIYPNPELRSESGWSSELGVKQGLAFGKITGQADISFFYSENSDMIEYVFGLYPDPITQILDFGFRPANVKESRVYGFETEFLLNLPIGSWRSSFGGGYTFIYPVELNKGSQQNADIYLKYRRKHSLKIVLNTSYKKLEISLNLFYRSKILNIDDVFLNPLTRENILPGFYDYWQQNNTGSFVADSYIAWKLNKNLKLSFSVKNLTNTEYMGRPGDIMPQRFYSLQFSGDF